MRVDTPNMLVTEILSRAVNRYILQRPYTSLLNNKITDQSFCRVQTLSLMLILPLNLSSHVDDSIGMVYFGVYLW